MLLSALALAIVSSRASLFISDVTGSTVAGGNRPGFVEDAIIETYCMGILYVYYCGFVHIYNCVYIIHTHIYIVISYIYVYYRYICVHIHMCLYIHNTYYMPQLYFGDLSRTDDESLWNPLGISYIPVFNQILYIMWGFLEMQ